MNIIVCVKPVPDPDKYSLLKIDPQSKRLVREGIPTVVNPSDKCALEAALQIKAKLGGKVTVVSMAPEFTADKLKECLAMGADELYIISDRAFGGADTYATSYTLAQAIKALPDSCDLVLLGNESADGATAQVAPQLGEWLGLPHISNVTELSVEEGTATAKKKLENGYITYSVRLPAAISVSRSANKPRLISAMGVIKAKNKPLTIWRKGDFPLEDESKIGLDGSPTSAGLLIEPDISRSAQPLTGELEEIADQIIAVIKKSGITL